MVQRQEVVHIAELSKLSFEEHELEAFAAEFSNILELLETLEEVDTEGVKPTYHGNQIMNVYREDRAIINKHYQALLNNAPMVKGGFIQVPAILDSQEEA